LKRGFIMNRTKKPWINLLFLVITLGVNTLGALGWINGLSQKEISDMYTTFITPSPSTFSIWSVIYILLLISTIVMIIRKRDRYYQKTIDEITVLFIISCLLNMAWIISFSYLMIELSTLFIFTFVIILSIICLRLKKIHDGRHFLLPLTFGIYTGWAFIATVVNVAVTLVKVNWNGFGIAPEVWAGIILIIAIILVFIVLKTNRNAVFPLPIAWAYFGIYQFLKSPEGFKGEYSILQTIALAGMAVLIGMAAIQLYQNHFSLFPEKAK
jgi:translocator protein